MSEYENFIKRSDLIKNLVDREKLAEQKKKPNKSIQEANRQRWLQYQEIQRMSLTAKIAAANASGGTSVDVDAQAFITAAAITDATQQSAIDTLVTGLKTDGIWTKMKAIYPFVGGTATTHKFNLKDPRDLDAAFRLTFSGGWTHSSTGALPNGTNAYADTKLNANTNLTFANTHFSIYSRTNTTVNANSIGVFNNVLSIYALAILGTTGLQYDGYDYTAHRLVLSNANSLGHYIGNVSSTTSQKIFKNGSVLGSVTAAQTQTSLPNLNFYLSTRNDNNVASAFDSKQLAFSTIGDGLTDTQASNLYTRVQAFQTTLSRQV